ncbi:MAG: glycosyltransferase family 2 protein [Brockia lithotrophica]|nr:glycosyltransferase family 2 protein [Brockia lithotrophica]
MRTRASVIVPAWNAERTIEQAIRSVQVQTLSDLEILVIDDGSKDGTAEVVRRIAAEDGRVRLLRNEVNRGPSAARNLGLREARGDWLAILDADDFFFRKDRLELLISVGEGYGADIVADDLYVFKDGDTRYLSKFKEILGIVIDSPREIDLSFFINYDLGSLKPIFRTKFIKEKSIKYNENLVIREDFVLIVELMLNGAKFILYPQAGYAYRVHSNSIQTKVYDEKEELNKDSIEYIQKILSDPRMSQKERESLIRYIRLANYYRFISMIKRKRLLKSIKIFKEDPRVFFVLLNRILNK